MGILLYWGTHFSSQDGEENYLPQRNQVQRRETCLLAGFPSQLLCFPHLGEVGRWEEQTEPQWVPSEVPLPGMCPAPPAEGGGRTVRNWGPSVSDSAGPQASGQRTPSVRWAVRLAGEGTSEEVIPLLSTSPSLPVTFTKAPAEGVRSVESTGGFSWRPAFKSWLSD